MQDRSSPRPPHGLGELPSVARLQVPSVHPKLPPLRLGDPRR